MWRGILIPLIAFASIGCRREPPQRESASGPDSGYVNAAVCAGCHAEIARNYRQTGMGRSFSAARKEKMFEDFSGRTSYHHKASNRYYTMIEREGRYIQRRHQLDPAGRETNVIEQEIHFVMGSGNHARTYLHRTAQGRLMELPLAWYSNKGGYWAMNPGYDRRDHPGFRRAISDDCMFCHNSYPEVPEASRAAGADPTFPEKLPEGIDCQRCHGPGREHVEAAGAGRPKEEVSKRIFNSARLSPERQLELCMQCHLESTTRALPYSIIRFDRGPYSYRPEEPLGDYILHFDYAPGKGPDDHFEIAHAAYRFRKSKCFTQSGGKLTCTTCHDPHEAKRGAEAVRLYSDVCRQCHSNAHVQGRPKQPSECLSCHMPKRVTDDVVHVVMTDHYIRERQPDRDLLAPLSEHHETKETAYRGEVVLNYPPRLPDGAEKDLYLATAQVYSGANLKAGTPQLQTAIERYKPRQVQFYHHLAEAHFRSGDLDAATAWYRKALERDSGYLPSIRNLGETLARLGRFSESAEILRRAPDDPVALNNLGDALLKQGLAEGAVQALRRALRLDPDSPEALNNLGMALARSGDPKGALEAWQSAVRVKPDFALAHNNLANSFHASSRWDQARRHFEEALLDPSYATARYNYGTALAERGDFDGAERQLAEAVRLDPSLADAHLNLGNIQAMKGQPKRAAAHFANALQARPDSGRARIGLGVALSELGRTAEAIEQFRVAARDQDPEIRGLAARALQQLSPPR